MRSLLWLKGAFTISLLLLIQEIPIWATSIGLLLFLWKIALDSMNWLPPAKLTTGILAVAVLIFSRLHYGSFIGRENAATLFLVLGALKLLEVTNERDRQFTRFLILGALSVKFLFAIEIWVFIPALIGTFLIFLDFRKVEKENLEKEVKVVGKIWMYAVPLALIFFVAFPRFQSPFGSRQVKSVTGFSPTLGPGSVTQLALSREPVMRVLSPKKEFGDGYWTGDYLYKSQGLSWSKGGNSVLGTKRVSPTEFSGREWDYSVTLEPHQFASLFFLSGTETLLTPGQSLYRLADGTFVIDHSLRARIQYNGYLHKNADAAALVETNRSQDLLDYPELSPELQAEFKYISENKNLSRKEIVLSLVEYVKSKKFKYTLTPGDRSQTLDDFILSGRKGFCEHYAAGFGTILRHLGVPTRTAIGYQGGEWNEVGSYLLITQQDAHAWIEFLNDKGEFEKLDLVNFVAPDRLVLGAREFSERYDQETGALASSRDGFISQFLVAKNTVVLWIDSLNYMWIQFLIDFNIEKQKEIVGRLKDFWPVVLVGLVLLLSFASLYKQLRILRNEDPAVRAVKSLHQWAVERGWLESQAYVGPLSVEQTYQKRGIEPDAVHRIFEQYKSEAFYGKPLAKNSTIKRDLKKIKKSIKAFEL